MMQKVLSLGLATSLAFTISHAQDPYALDNAFGTAGLQIAPNPLFGSSPYRVSKVWNMEIASDDKMILGSNITVFYPGGLSFDYGLTRLTADGEIDSSFNGTGFLVFNGTNQPDAKQLDNLLLLPDDKILYAGQSTTAGASKIVIYKINTDGSFDASFGQNGVIRVSAGARDFNALRTMGLQSDGKILLLASNFSNASSTGSILRLNGNGSVDNSFGTNGVLVPNLGFSHDGVLYSMIRVLNDNSFLVVGTHVTITSQADIREDFLAKFNADGSVQTSFGTNGKIVLPKVGTERLFYLNKYIDVDEDGSIYVNCSTTDYPANGPANPIVLVYKVSPDGTLITSFGQNGRLTIADLYWDSWYAYDACIQDGNKLLVAAMADSGIDAHYKLKRFNADGTDDLSFAGLSNELSGTRNALDHFRHLGLQSDNNIILAGYGKGLKSVEDSLFPAVMRFTPLSEEDPSDSSGTAISPVAGMKPITLYPNPVSHWLHIEGLNENTRIQLFDITGKPVMRSTLSGRAARSVDCSQLAAGVYWLHLEEEESRHSYWHKFIVQ